MVRLFGFTNGNGYSGYTEIAEPIQSSVGVFNEDALQRLDLVIQQAASSGIRLIIPFINFESQYGGYQWCGNFRGALTTWGRMSIVICSASNSCVICHKNLIFES